MRRVLVPIDGSAHAVRALEYIADRRKQGDRFEVLLLNVQPGMPPNRFVSRKMISEFQNNESEKVLSAPKIRTLQRLLKADAYSEVGDAAETIVKFAKKTGCHEIVMGARGMTSLKGLFVGSVATKVTHLAAIPVTIVK
ncbi:MAG: universal stress protein [Rhodospirillaceae bacterium]|nr:universal stress protein [Rhodospirillaceae bacterium]